MTLLREQKTSHSLEQILANIILDKGLTPRMLTVSENSVIKAEKKNQQGRKEHENLCRDDRSAHKKFLSCVSCWGNKCSTRTSQHWLKWLKLGICPYQV